MMMHDGVFTFFTTLMTELGLSIGAVEYCSLR